MPVLPNSYMSLERYRQLLGATIGQFYNLSFDGCGFYSPSNVGCSDDWTYYNYGNVLNFYDLTTAINQSVLEIEAYLGHLIRPSFVCSEQPYPVNLPYPPYSVWPSFWVGADYQRIGKKTTATVGTATQAGGTLTFEDRNGDGFKEVAVINLVLTSTTGENCWLNVTTSDGYTIRPISIIANTTNSIVIEIDSYLVLNNGLYNPLDPSIAPLDACNLADNVLFASQLVVTETYPDETQAARFKLYNNPILSCGGCGSADCEACTATYQTACLQDTGLGDRLRPIPANWDADTQKWCNLGDCSTMCRPTSVELNYYANPCQKDDCSTADCWAICPQYERAVFYLTNARLGDVCDCGCEGGNIRKYQREIAGERGPNTYDNAGLSFEMIDKSPFGTRYGEVQAYVMLRQNQTRNLYGVMY